MPSAAAQVSRPIATKSLCPLMGPSTSNSGQNPTASHDTGPNPGFKEDAMRAAAAADARSPAPASALCTNTSEKSPPGAASAPSHRATRLQSGPYGTVDGQVRTADDWAGTLTAPLRYGLRFSEHICRDQLTYA